MYTTSHSSSTVGGGSASIVLFELPINLPVGDAVCHTCKFDRGLPPSITDMMKGYWEFSKSLGCVCQLQGRIGAILAWYPTIERDNVRVSEW